MTSGSSIVGKLIVMMEGPYTQPADLSGDLHILNPIEAPYGFAIGSDLLCQSKIPVN